MRASPAKLVIDGNANSVCRSLFSRPTREHLTPSLSESSLQPSSPRTPFVPFLAVVAVFLMTFGAVSGMVQSFGSQSSGFFFCVHRKTSLWHFK